ncbi:hypothetical protein WR164_09910 [Philodulcilactobacillus myokoensis]|uniref:Uncharacterized protein n=1 Tax=Philodulcilactobacillus myokoensis TaxID=2929573 RepID=A0A9W6B129_9LACO|nr:hypothetical protein [Philodulcilactobacillus myokoensis]GLB47012.1 hypothetical protein WR164_09910 [Philodulcilactobacillus myokoensis]
MDNNDFDRKTRLTREEYQNNVDQQAIDQKKQIAAEKSQRLAKFWDKVIIVLIVLITLVFLILFFVNF